MAKLSVLNRLGNAFAALFGKHGDVSAQAQKVGCSRQTVYHHADQVEQAVAEAQLPGPSRAELLEENRRLRQENQQLRQQLQQTQRQARDSIRLDQAQRQRLAVLTWAMGLSLNQIVDLFAVLLADSDAKVPGRATIGHWVLAFAHQAGKVLAVLDEHARLLARVLCLDEIFFHRKPVLMGVEPASMALLLCQRAADRSGETWYRALRPFEQLEFALSDQGTGLQAGLRQLAQERQQQAVAAEGPVKPLLSNGLDLFHIEQAAQPILARRWREVEQGWTKAEKAEAVLAQAKAQGQTRKLGGLSRRVQTAWKKVASQWQWYEGLEQAWQKVKAALALFRPDGGLNDRAWARQEIQAACQVLRGPSWKKVRDLLQDPRTLAFLDRTQQLLRQAEPRAELREALVRLWRREHEPRSGASVGAAVVLRLVCARLAADWAASYQRVQEVLSRVVRASSAVECINSVLRMQQTRHKNLSQPMLDLKRLYWNCRPFRRGKRRGKCPYQHLGLLLPTYDFWQLLQRDPEQLRQELSNQRLAA